MTQSRKSYSAEELRQVAQMAAGAGAGAVMRLAPHVEMPSEDILFAIEEVLADARDGCLPCQQTPPFAQREEDDVPSPARPE